MKKELCIVHIGMPKTGSSILQEVFHGGCGDQRVSYPHLLAFNHGSVLWGMFMEHPENYHFYVSKGWNKEEIEAYCEENKKILIESFKNKDKSIELISGEDLFHFTENAIQKLHEFLFEYFETVVIVGYVRPVKSFLESAFQQLVKYHEQSDLGFEQIYHHYRNFKKFDDVFGRSNVKLFKFNPTSFVDNDIVSDFCAQLGITQTKSIKRSANESISKGAISVLFAYHNYSNKHQDFAKLTYAIKEKVIKKLSSLDNEKFKLSNTYINSIVETYIDDYSWIQQRLNDPLEESLDVDANMGVTNEQEILEYSVTFIPKLADLLKNKINTALLAPNYESVGIIMDLIVKETIMELNTI